MWRTMKKCPKRRTAILLLDYATPDCVKTIRHPLSLHLFIEAGASAENYRLRILRDDFYSF
jgi:hypothetical protein